MAREVANKDIRDTNTHIFEAKWAGEPERTMYQFYNGLDSAVVIKAFATFDGDDWSKEVQLRRMKITSSSPAKAPLSDAWDRIRFKVTPQATPSSGSFEIHEHAKV